MQEYIAMWKNYANFKDRTTLRGYWMAFLFNFLVSLVVGTVASLLKFTLLSSLYSLAVLIPSLAISVRRLRDAGKGWGWIFINFVPLVGWIIWIVMLCKPSVDVVDADTAVV